MKAEPPKNPASAKAKPREFSDRDSKRPRGGGREEEEVCHREDLGPSTLRQDRGPDIVSLLRISKTGAAGLCLLWCGRSVITMEV